MNGRILISVHIHMYIHTIVPHCVSVPSGRVAPGCAGGVWSGPWLCVCGGGGGWSRVAPGCAGGVCGGGGGGLNCTHTPIAAHHLLTTCACVRALRYESHCSN